MKPKLVTLVATITLVSASAFANCVGYTGPGGPQGQAVDYQPDQVADCLPGLVEDYPQAPVVDFPPGQEAAYLRALVAGSLRDLEGECLPAREAGFPPGQAVVCLQDLAAASQLGPATTGDEFRRNSKVAPTGCETRRTDRA